MCPWVLKRNELKWLIVGRYRDCPFLDACDLNAASVPLYLISCIVILALIMASATPATHVPGGSS